MFIYLSKINSRAWDSNRRPPSRLAEALTTRPRRPPRYLTLFNFVQIFYFQSLKQSLTKSVLRCAGLLPELWLYFVKFAFCLAFMCAFSTFFVFFPCSLLPPFISTFTLFLGSECHSCVNLSIWRELALCDISACVVVRCC